MLDFCSSTLLVLIILDHLLEMTRFEQWQCTRCRYFLVFEATVESHKIIHHATFSAPTDNSEPNCLFTNLNIFIRIASDFFSDFCQLPRFRERLIMEMELKMKMMMVVMLNLIRGSGWVGQRPRLSINCVAQPALLLSSHS